MHIITCHIELFGDTSKVFVKSSKFSNNRVFHSYPDTSWTPASPASAELAIANKWSKVSLNHCFCLEMGMSIIMKKSKVGQKRNQ